MWHVDVNKMYLLWATSIMTHQIVLNLIFLRNNIYCSVWYCSGNNKLLRTMFLQSFAEASKIPGICYIVAKSTSLGIWLRFSQTNIIILLRGGRLWLPRTLRNTNRIIITRYIILFFMRVVLIIYYAVYV